MTLDDIIAALEGTPIVLGRLVRELPEATLRAGHDADNWSIKEVVVHLRDADEIALERVQRMAKEDMPFLPAYDQAVYARDRGYQEQNAAVALEGFTSGRGRMVSFFKGLMPAALDCPGSHEETGRITIGGHIEHMISHDLTRLAQISRVLGGG